MFTRFIRVYLLVLFFNFNFSSCVGPLNAANIRACRGTASEEATIDPSLGKTMFRFVPLVGEEGTYRIVIKDRSTKGCSRFLSADGDCSISTVFFTREDLGGLQRWVITKVDPDGVSPSPAPTDAPTVNPSPTPTEPVLTEVPTLEPIPPTTEPPAQAPSITAAYATSFSSANVTFTLPDVPVRNCNVTLEPGSKSVTIDVPSLSRTATASFSKLSAGTRYSAVASCQLSNGKYTPNSDRVTFSVRGGIYDSTPPEVETKCDGRGEIISNEGRCVCDAENIEEGPFKANGKGGCVCLDESADRGYGSCICQDPFVKSSEGFCVCPPTFEPDGMGGCRCPEGLVDRGKGYCQCPLTYGACDTGCCPCAQYEGASELTDTGVTDMGTGSYGGSGAVAINTEGNVIATAGLISNKPNGYVFSYDGSKWVKQTVDAIYDEIPGTGWFSALALNGNGSLVLIADYDYALDTQNPTAPNVKTEGVAVLFENVKGNWNFVQNFTGPLKAAEFGFSVGMDRQGEVIIVSDIYEPYPDLIPGVGNVDQGSIYIYRRSEGQYVLEGKLIASDWNPAPNPMEGDYFGDSIISADGKRIAAREVAHRPGKVYMIEYTGSGWQDVQILRGSQTPSDKQFGRSMAMNYDGTVVAAGDPLTNNGQVYIFRYNGQLWDEEVILTGDNTASVGSNFGHSVALNDAGDVLVVGDYDADTSGRVYVFRYVEESWDQVQMLQAEDDFEGTLGTFGHKVVVNGVGDIIGVNDKQKHVYVYQNICE